MRFAHEICALLGQEVPGCVREVQEDDWERMWRFFEEHRVCRTD